jgi:UDP-N-acetyl-D-galactosamine dehydrogenase
VGYHPEVILAGRRINDGMGAYVARQLVKQLIQNGVKVRGSRVLVLGLAFKEDCPDLRNTRVVDIIEELADYQAMVDVHDPWIDPADAAREYGLKPVAAPEQGAYDAVVLAVAHSAFKEMGAAALRAFGKAGAVLYDVKSVFPKEASDLRL